MGILWESACERRDGEKGEGGAVGGRKEEGRRKAWEEERGNVVRGREVKRKVTKMKVIGIGKETEGVEQRKEGKGEGEEGKQREGRGDGWETQPNLSCGKSLLSSFSERFVVMLVLATLERR